MYGKKVNILLVAGLVMISTFSLGQGTNSPFTSRGIGDIYDAGQVYNNAMGGIGISNGNYWHLNTLNPALLPYNSLTVFSAGLNFENRSISNSSLSESESGGAMSYLATAFPIVPGWWTTSLGLQPYSVVDYNFTFESQIEGSDVPVLITESGSGGLSQFYWSNGIVISKEVFIGLKGSYLFSSLETRFENEIQDTTLLTQFIPVSTTRLSVSDFMGQLSLAYKKDSVFNNKIEFRAGLTYDLKSTINAQQFKSASIEFINSPLVNDTLSNQSGSIVIPQAFGVGISFNKGIEWVIGLDAKYQQWSEYKDFDGNNTELDDSYKIALGGEFTPDPSSVDKYFKRIVYRAGLSYAQTPFLINGKRVKDFGINFGWSLPVSRFSSLDMAFKFGQRGNISDNTIDEKYFQFQLGVTFNDQWFIKRKYD